MTKNRLEAFSDGVIAIIITIMVLELKVPHSTEPEALLDALPGWLRYGLSFVYVGIYWVNHHALLDRATRVDWAALWANLHLLFWMSLIPWVTAWAGENPTAPVPVAMYGVVLLLCSGSFMLLAWRLREGADGHVLAWSNRRNAMSLPAYALAVGVSLWRPPLAAAVHVLLALAWLVPQGQLRQARG
ncbi:hypothetical protein B0920_05410 [Massilia sp. KIM]|uniref:TMEM175 family protein n=1 Tax=Massilia sp. KIM TaxID=1955422 RepID=UPI00098F6C02|nr:TMEM175 family protein [Massilia sp. KIM]OON62870.1 hypothetical protein B0920_05410 [Massilia sp. KIM]